MDELMLLSAIASHLNTLDSRYSATGEHSGGGIHGINVLLPDFPHVYSFWGRCDTIWAADINAADGNHLGTITTRLPSDTPDPAAVAEAIHQAILRYQPCAMCCTDMSQMLPVSRFKDDAGKEFCCLLCREQHAAAMVAAAMEPTAPAQQAAVPDQNTARLYHLSREIGTGAGAFAIISIRADREPIPEGIERLPARWPQEQQVYNHPLLAVRACPLLREHWEQERLTAGESGVETSFLAFGYGALCGLTTRVEALIGWAERELSNLEASAPSGEAPYGYDPAGMAIQSCDECGEPLEEGRIGQCDSCLPEDEDRPDDGSEPMDPLVACACGSTQFLVTDTRTYTWNAWDNTKTLDTLYDPTFKCAACAGPLPGEPDEERTEQRILRYLDAISN